MRSMEIPHAMTNAQRNQKKKSSWVCILFLTPDGSAAHWALFPL